MAEASISVAPDQFCCPVCLDLLKDPVALPCGHSYCMICITDTNIGPIYRSTSITDCRQTFTPRPVLSKNTILAEMVEKLIETTLQSAAPTPAFYADPEDVECNVCSGRKHKAVKSCLVCLNSYCHTHLEQHENFFKDRKHNLIEATRRLQEMICKKHNRPLEAFCRTDQKCICMMCMLDIHKNHEINTAVVGRIYRQRQLQEKQRKYKEEIQQKQNKMQELKKAVDSHKRSAQAVVEHSEKIFTELIHSIERRRSEVTQLIRDQEKAAVSQAEGFLKTLEEAIDFLKKRDTDNIGKSVSLLRGKLEDFCKEEVERISARVKSIKITDTDNPKTREEFLQYSCQLSLDPNTVNKHLCLSQGNRVVTYTKNAQQYPKHPDRFDGSPQVLCRESVCGRAYWEADWSGNCWVGISVSYKSIGRKRKGDDEADIFGYNDQSWTLQNTRARRLFTHNSIDSEINKPLYSSRIGVYMDHSAGTLSFYSVSDTMTLLKSVQTTSTEPLYPGFKVLDGSSVKLCDLTR
ncbi:E3 ubiquitin-protein ligase TRIM16-like [Ctenopharyngodon idella]|uniref:E3 ubiquitin-protein ligase TRIM16-like n=1 Tax=Ctenopharyngodon idella TaxID=7959 RepID=UPI00222F33D3|nr:E3 ubiquitin-protein ligase TRIM16-like [Ctenopharyngodon idella]